MIAYYALVLFSGIIIASYFFNILSKKIHVPAVVLLIFFGIILQLSFSVFSFEISLNYLRTGLYLGDINFNNKQGMTLGTYYKLYKPINFKVGYHFSNAIEDISRFCRIQSRRKSKSNR